MDMERIVVSDEENLKRVIREVVKEELDSFLVRWSEHAGAEEPLLTRKQMAEYLHISLVTLTDWVKRGLPVIRKGGRVLFLKSEVLATVKDRRTLKRPAGKKCSP